MKKKLYFLSTLLLCAAVLSLSSCLKDNRYVDFSKGTPIVEFNLGGLAYFGPDAITEASDTVVKQFAVSIASTTLPTTATTIQLAVDNSIVTTYNTANTAINYLTFPTDAYVFNNTTVTIPAGQRVAIVSVTFYKSKFDQTLSYMLPIKIVSASGGTSLVSANMGIHYYHFIGNVFAGAYLWDFTRTPAAGNFVGDPATLSPVTPTQFETVSGYYTQKERYEVTFAITGSGPTATYSNFQVTLNSDDVDNIFTPAGISVTASPAIITPGYDPTKQYTYAEAITLFDFQYSVLGSSGARINEDRFYKP
jgi:hypothetical protein